MNFKGSDRKKASELLFDSLQEQILQGVYHAGEKLPTERELAKRYGRSQTSVREALRLLESAGYIDVVQGGGILVRAPGYRAAVDALQELLILRRVSSHDVFEFFAKLGPKNAELAAERRTEEDLQSLLEELRSILEGEASSDRFYQAFAIFQMKMARATHNPVIGMVWRAALEILPEEIRVDLGGLAPDRLVREYKRLYECIEAQDAQGAGIFATRCWVIFKEMRRMYLLGPDREMSASGGRKRSDEICRKLREEILRGNLRPGDRLPPERTLAELYGCSRPVVREAIKMLELRNLVTLVQGSGCYINEFTTQEIGRVMSILKQQKIVTPQQLLEFRFLAGTTVAGWSAARRTAPELAAMQEALQKAREALSDPREFRQQILAFKQEMAASCHNEFILILNDMTEFADPDGHRLSETFPREADLKVLEQCEALCDAIARRDVERAAGIDLEHLTYIGTQIAETPELL